MQEDIIRGSRYVDLKNRTGGIYEQTVVEQPTIDAPNAKAKVKLAEISKLVLKKPTPELTDAKISKSSVAIKVKN